MTSSAMQTTRPTPRDEPALLLAIAALWLPAAALAEGSACDQLKATLASRIEASGVRGYTLEVVPGATPVPTGAKAIGSCEGGERKLLYRRWGGASAPPPSAASAVATEPAQKRLPPPVRLPLPLPAPVASMAVPTSVPVVAPTPAPALAPAALQEVPTQPVALQVPLSQRASAFINANWRWLLALLLVPLAALGWAWRAHHLAFDKNGLPRGPRL